MRTWILLLLLLIVPSRAELLDPGTGKRLVITATDHLIELDPDTGATRDLLTLPGLSQEGALKQLSSQLWVLVTGKALIGLAPEGKVLWTHPLENELAWGPEAAGESSLAFVTGTELVRLDKDGRPTLKATLPGKPSRVLAVGGDWLVVVPAKEPTPPDYGYRRPPENEPPPPKPEPTKLILLDGQGKTLWTVEAKGKVEEGPWPSGQRILVLDQGGPESPFLLLSLQSEPGSRFGWDLPLQSRLLGAPKSMGPDLLLLEKSRLLAVDQDSGTLRWEESLGELALDAEGEPLVLIRDADLAAFVKGENRTRVVTLNRQTGDTENELEVAGEPVYALPDGERLRAFFKTSASEPRLDTGGHVIKDPKSFTDQQSFVESFQLVELGDTATVLADGPRQSLVGAPRVQDGILYYATRVTPAQAQGEARRIDVKYPQEPVVLHAVDLKTGKELWAYRPARPDDRIDESWDFAGDAIWFATPDHRVVLLDPKTGQVQGISPVLSEAPGAVERVGDKLLVSLGTNAYQGLGRDAGPAWAEHDFVPFFDYAKLNNLIGVIVLIVFLAYFIFAARRKQLFIRRIAGLNALDEAVGRATEMGKPVLYVHGLADVDDIQVLASLSILGHVARKTAEYDTPILVPCSRSVVMSTAQEVVKEAYTAAGRPDAFQRDNINYLTDEQFGYVAGVDGIMLREKPAANFYLGTFYAESLILAETGHSTGAIQIAGTAMPSQLPFFVSACDYTLIGEELYAASAYLSRDPMQVGSLRGQDVGKAVLMLCIFLGAVLVTFHIDIIKEWFQ